MSQEPEQHEPQTDEEWQEAVNMSSFLLLLDSGRKYGLLTGGPVVRPERCEEILKRGSEKGIYPDEGAIKELTLIMAGAYEGGAHVSP